jgi:uncharacterized protein
VADSLRDQLVKAGLATSAQAKKAERQANRAQSPKKKQPGEDKKPAPKQRARALKQQKAEKDRAIAAQRNDKYAARALRAEIKQITLQNDQRAKESKDDDVPYNFVHGKKIKRIYLPDKQRAQLVNGSLVIVNNDGLYHFVDKAVADKIAQRDPKRIIVAHTDEPQETSEDDEYYAKFAVPDDLDW